MQGGQGDASLEPLCGERRAVSGGQPQGSRGTGTGWGQHSLFAQGTPKSHSPNFSRVSSLFTCGTGSPLSLAWGRQRGLQCRQGSAPLPALHPLPVQVLALHGVPSTPRPLPDPQTLLPGWCRAQGSPRMPHCAPAEQLTSTGPTCDVTCDTLSLEDESRMRARHRDGDCPIPGQEWTELHGTAGSPTERVQLRT